MNQGEGLALDKFYASGTGSMYVLYLDLRLSIGVIRA